MRQNVSMKTASMAVAGAISLASHAMAVAQSEETPMSDGRARAEVASSTNLGIESVTEVVVVTAQKREERLQDVPISIAVLGGDHLDRSSQEGVTEALSKVPGVAITSSTQGSSPQISVRGVTAPSNIGVGSSPIAYYLDSVPFAFVKNALYPDASAYDLERVEILRGPQGTLYGASAQNGVVRVLTRKANLDRVEAKFRASGSSTQHGGTNYRGDMAVNVPIIEGKLAARAVAGYQDLSGWIDKPNDRDANDARLTNLRLKLNAQPTEQLSVGLSTWLSRSDQGAPAAGDDRRQHRSIVDESIRTDYDVYSLELDYEFSGVTLSSATSYLDYELDSRLDSRLNDSGTNILATDIENSIFAEEVYLRSTADGPWQWSLGAMYRKAKDGLVQERRNSAGELTGGYVAPSDIEYTSRSVAVFGELTRTLIPGRLDLTGGLRYFEDKVTLDENSRLSALLPGESLIDGKESKFDAVSPRVVLTWFPSDEMTFYASYAEGFRSGSDQAPPILAIAPNLPPADADNLKSYELGMKGTLWGGTVAVDVAAYFQDWQDVQQPLQIDAGDGLYLTTLVNGTSASGYGLDLGVTARVTQGLTLDAGFSVNDLQQDTDVYSGGILLFNRGDRLNLSPKYTVNGGLDYVFPLGWDGLEGSFSASAHYVSERDQRLFSITSATLSSKSITTAEAKFSVASDDGWTAMLFVDNLTNEQNAVLSVPAGGFPERALRLRPRTVGVQFEYRY